MPRPRTNDPSNLPAAPRLARTPQRESQIVEKFKSRLAYIRSSFCSARRLLADDYAEYNRSLDRLQKRIERIEEKMGRGERIHPEIEMVISFHARKLAAAEGCEVGQMHVNEAARIAVRLLSPRRGRPDDRALDHHVRGLMALIQETAGLPVMARKDRNSDYGPHFAKGVSELVPTFFQEIDPTITTRSLVTIVLEARKEFAGREMRFLDFFPFYGATSGESGIELRPGRRLEALELNIPIYCP